MSNVSIRPLQSHDYAQWLPLWNANNLGVVNEAVTARTWARLMDADENVCGLAAEQDGNLVGLLHYILHPTTGSLDPACYMQDVFVAENARRHGIARKLVEALIAEGRKQGWARIYWLAEGKNEAAAALYKNLGVQLDFNLYVVPLGAI
jgi:GNAT superfamily N-acetyltransferase